MNSTIDINSTDEERTNILKEKTLTVVAWDKSKEMIITDPKENTSHALSRYIDEQNLRGKEIKFKDFEICFSRTTLNESIRQMTKRHANLINLGKLLSVLDKVCFNAIRIETEEYRHFFLQSSVGNEIKQVHQYLSAFYDVEIIYPVKITIFETKKKQKNRFYMVITIGGIEIDKTKEAITNTGVHSEKSEESLSESDASLAVNIADLTQFFNKDEGIIIKNLPDGLLSPEQIEIKEKVIKHDEMKENKFINMLFSKVL